MGSARLIIRFAILHGKIIEEYPERGYPGIETCLMYATLSTNMPVHLVVDVVEEEAVVVVTVYVPDRDQWIASQIRRQKWGKRRMKCLKCHRGELQIGTTSLTYHREGSVIQVQVDGLPAEICPVCGEAYLSDAVAQHIFDMVDPLLKVGQEMRGGRVLPAPTVDIHFPPLTPTHLEWAVSAERDR